MKPISFSLHALHLLSAGALGLLVAQWPALVVAQTIEPPPRLEKLEEPPPASAPQKTESKQRIIETRDQRGQVISIEVKDERASYYVKPGSITGNSILGSPENNSVRPAQFKIFEFDMKRPGEGEKGNTAPTPSGTR
jgi:hypothetical protein